MVEQLFQQRPDVGDNDGCNDKNHHDGGGGEERDDGDGGNGRKKKKGKKKRRCCNDDHFERRFDLVLSKVDINVDVMGRCGKDKCVRGGSPAFFPVWEKLIVP
jgi:hypothetical protein